MTRGLQLHGTDITDTIFGMHTAYISQTYTKLSFSLCNVLHLEGTQIHILVILGDLFCDITWRPSHVDRFPRMSNPPQQWHTISIHFTGGWCWCTFHPRYLNPRVLTNRSQTCWLHMVTKCMSCQIWLHFEYLWWTFRVGNSFVLSMFTSNKDSPEVKDF